MTREDWAIAWQKVNGLWPGWKTTTAMAEVWAKHFAPFSRQAFIKAVEHHYEDASDKYGPNIKTVSKLAKEFAEFVGPSEERLEIQNRWHAMHAIEQAQWAESSARLAAFRAESAFDRERFTAEAVKWEGESRRIVNARGGKPCCPLHAHLYQVQEPV